MHIPCFSWDETQGGPRSAGDTIRPRETLGKKSKLVRLMSPEKMQLSVLRYPLLSESPTIVWVDVCCEALSLFLESMEERKLFILTGNSLDTKITISIWL